MQWVRRLRVHHPFRIDELRDTADGLLSLVGCDPCKVDGDPVEVTASSPDLRLAHSKRVDTLGDHVDGPLLDIRAGLSWRKVDQLVVDVGPTRQVETFMNVKLPAAEVGRQAGHVPGQRVVIRDPVEVAGPVDEKGKQQDRYDDQPNGPAED